MKGNGICSSCGVGTGKMEMKCLSCGRRIFLDQVVFQKYFGTVKCSICGSMLEVKTKDGVLLGANLLVPRLYLKVPQKEIRNQKTARREGGSIVESSTRLRM